VDNRRTLVVRVTKQASEQLDSDTTSCSRSSLCQKDIKNLTLGNGAICRPISNVIDVRARDDAFDRRPSCPRVISTWTFSPCVAVAVVIFGPVVVTQALQRNGAWNPASREGRRNFLAGAAPHLGHQLPAHGLKQASWTLVIGIRGQRLKPPD